MAEPAEKKKWHLPHAFSGVFIFVVSFDLHNDSVSHAFYLYNGVGGESCSYLKLFSLGLQLTSKWQID